MTSSTSSDEAATFEAATFEAATFEAVPMMGRREEPSIWEILWPVAGLILAVAAMVGLIVWAVPTEYGPSDTTTFFLDESGSVVWSCPTLGNPHSGGVDCVSEGGEVRVVWDGSTATVARGNFWVIESGVAP